MSLRIVGVIALMGLLAVGGCRSRKDRPPPAPVSQTPASDASNSPDVRSADQLRQTSAARTAITQRMRGPRGEITRSAPASSPSTQPAQTPAQEKYLDSASQQIRDLDDKTQEQADKVAKLSEHEQETFDALAKAFDDKTYAAYERFEDLSEASPGQWKDGKLKLEQAMADQQKASTKLLDWLASTGKASAEHR